MLNMGTILTVLSKFSLACAPSVFFVFIAKSIDRFAKGLRQAPSDAILAELATKKGFAYSFRYVMNLSGFLTGSIITSAIVTTLGKNFRLIFALAVVPALITVYILKTKIKYNDETLYKQMDKQKWSIKDVSLMPKAYWQFIIVITILMFNRFSEGFITLRAKEVLPEYVSNFPIFMSFYEICAICIAVFVGKISDKFDKRKILLFGIYLLLIADIFAIIANNLFTTIAIYIFAGLHIGATQVLIGSIIAKTAPKHLIGTAFAIYYGVDGLILFLSNNMAGASLGVAKYIGLQGSSGPFILGLIASIAAILYILIWTKNEKISL